MSRRITTGGGTGFRGIARGSSQATLTVVANHSLPVRSRDHRRLRADLLRGAFEAVAEIEPLVFHLIAEILHHPPNLVGRDARDPDSAVEP